MNAQELPYEVFSHNQLVDLCKSMSEAIASQTVCWNAIVAHASVRFNNGLPVDAEWIATLSASSSTAMKMLTADIQDIFHVREYPDSSPAVAVADRLNRILAGRKGETISEDEFRAAFEAATRG